jgi:hypothetical protein
MSHRTGNLLLSFAIAVVLTAAPVLAQADNRKAVRGTVVDSDSTPIVGAEVCYLLGEADGICVQTNEDGVYDLPTSHVSVIQIEASGFQSATLQVGKQGGRVVLQRAAALWVRVRDVASGRTIPESQVYLVFPGGRREGPLPANDKGVKIRTLVPGRYGILAHSEGYTQLKAVVVDLAGGDDDWVDVEMKRESKKR